MDEALAFVVIGIALRIPGKDHERLVEFDEIATKVQTGVSPSTDLLSTLLGRQSVEEATLEQQRPRAEDDHQALEGIAQIVRHAPALIKNKADHGITERRFATSPSAPVNDDRFYEGDNHSIETCRSETSHLARQLRLTTLSHPSLSVCLFTIIG